MPKQDHHVFFLVADPDVSEEGELHVIGGDEDLTCLVELHEGFDLHLHVLFLLLEALHGLVEEADACAVGDVREAVGFSVGWDHCSV